MFRWLSILWCDHDYWRKCEPGRVYLQCVKCRRTTPGWALTLKPFDRRTRVQDREDASRRDWRKRLSA